VASLAVSRIGSVRTAWSDAEKTPLCCGLAYPDGGLDRRPVPVGERLSGATAGSDDEDLDDAGHRSVANSASDPMVRHAKHVSVPLRRVCAGGLREEVLYEPKAGAAGGRLRRPSSAGRSIGSLSLPACQP
jgi:hypothetical protein